jgi:type VI secretion system protein ImpH
MQTEEQTSESDVIDHLFDEPAQYQFIQTLRVLLLSLRASGVPFALTFKQVQRFQKIVSLGFPASAIEALKSEFIGEPDESCDELLSAPAPPVHAPATQSEAAPQATITPPLIGRLDGDGALPSHFAQRIASQQQQQEDESARAYLDILASHVIGLFFEAWCNYRLESKAGPHGVDPLRPSSIQPGSFKQQKSNSPGSEKEVLLAHFAAQFRARPASALSIVDALTDHFGVPFELEQFVGCWQDLEPSALTILGRAGPTIGHGAIVGSRVWRRDLRVRLHIGPLNKQELDRFLPDGEAAAAMVKMLRQFDVAHLEFEVRLILKPECIQPVVLGAKKPDGMRLGWGTVLTRENGQPKESDVRYLLKTHAPRPPRGTPLLSVA